MGLCCIISVIVLLFGIAFGLETVASQLGCSYTFLVPKEANDCPQGAVDYDYSDLDTLRVVIKNQQEHLAMLTQVVMKLQEEIKQINNTNQPEGCPESPKRGDVTTGTNYVRWGRTICPGNAVLVYKGYAATSFYTHTGGGSNYICLDSHPQWPEDPIGGFQSSGHIYGVEYQGIPSRYGSVIDDDAPCAVCHIDGRGEQLMIPGNRTCPERWTKEYEGILVAEAYTHKRTTYVCLDKDPEVVTGGGPNTNGGLFYPTEVTCTTLPCPPFVLGYEIACVVCTL